MFRIFAISIPAPTSGIFFSNTREKNNNKLLIMNFKKKNDWRRRRNSRLAARFTKNLIKVSMTDDEFSNQIVFVVNISVKYDVPILDFNQWISIIFFKVREIHICAAQSNSTKDYFRLVYFVINSHEMKYESNSRNIFTWWFLFLWI